MVLHPLEEATVDQPVLFYPDAEAVLAAVPRRGVPMILRPKRDGTAEPFTRWQMSRLVRRLRFQLGLPEWFTLDACRHGGMTELEEAALTEGQGRALSAHKTHRAYHGYAKRTEARLLAATRKRRAHVLANDAGTSFQNERRCGFQNAVADDDAAIA